MSSLLADFAAETTIDRVHVLAELPGPAVASGRRRPARRAPGGRSGAGACPLGAHGRRVAPMSRRPRCCPSRRRPPGCPSRSPPARDGDVVAAAWGWSARGALEVADLVVAAEHRGQGIGRHVLAAVVALARRRECELVGAGAPRGGARRRAARPPPGSELLDGRGRRRSPVGAVPRVVGRRRRRLVTDGRRRSARPRSSGRGSRSACPWPSTCPSRCSATAPTSTSANVLEAGRSLARPRRLRRCPAVPGAAIHEVSTARARRRRRVGAREPGERRSSPRSACGACRTCCAGRGAGSPGSRCSCSPPTRGSGSPPRRSATSPGRSGSLLAGAAGAPRRDHRVLAGRPVRSGGGVPPVDGVPRGRPGCVAEQLGRRRRGCRCARTLRHRRHRRWRRRAVLRAVLARRPTARFDFLDSPSRLRRPAGATSVAGPSRTWRSSACSAAWCWPVGLPRLRRALAGWGTSVAFRFGVFAFVVDRGPVLPLPVQAAST